MRLSFHIMVLLYMGRVTGIVALTLRPHKPAVRAWEHPLDLELHQE